MATSILLIPKSADAEFAPEAVSTVVRSLWPTATVHRLGGDPFLVRLDVADRSFSVRVGRRFVSMSPGATLDECGITAHGIVQALGGTSRFYYMDGGNNHALVIDRRSTLLELAALPDALPLASR